MTYFQILSYSLTFGRAHNQRLTFVQEKSKLQNCSIELRVVLKSRKVIKEIYKELNNLKVGHRKIHTIV